jgi:hypothetical protein
VHRAFDLTKGGLRTRVFLLNLAIFKVSSLIVDGFRLVLPFRTLETKFGALDFRAILGSVCSCR